jgi:copper transport protein
MIQPPSRRLSVVVACACLLPVLAAPVAGAHALLRSCDPAGGASLDKAPEQVTMTFAEPPDPALSGVHVLDATGRAVERGRARVAAGKPLMLEVPLGQLGDGTYTVSWRVVSRTDGVWQLVRRRARGPMSMLERYPGGTAARVRTGPRPRWPPAASRRPGAPRPGYGV